MSYYEDEDNYGDEDQNDLMEMIRANKEEPDMEIKSQEANNKIHELLEEIDNHKTAQKNAGDALASAEMELNEILDTEYRKIEKE